MEKHIKKPLPDYETPGTPGNVLVKHDGEPVDHGAYRKFVGRILYAVVKVLPDCANAARDLTVHLSNPSTEHWKALIRLIGYLKHHYRALKLRAPRNLRPGAIFDATWGTDINDRVSVSGHYTTIGGTALVNYQSKKQQSVALSSCEAETMAGTVAAQDVMFEINMLREIYGCDPVLPAFIGGDNVASLFLAQNNAVGQRTKHIDTRHRFLGDLVQGDKPLAELRHIRSEDNPADIITKNAKAETHKKHADNVYNGMVMVQPMEEGVA